MPPRRAVDLVEATGGDCAGVVHHHVGIFRTLRQRRDVDGGRKIPGDDIDCDTVPIGELGRQGFELVARARRDIEIATLRRQCPSDRGTDAARGAGDERFPSRETQIHLISSRKNR